MRRPTCVRSAVALKDVKTYCFISSISAYASFRHAPIREIDPLADFSKIDPADRDLAHYGPQKAACEAEVGQVFGERGLLVRPGLIVGPGDRSGRFSHWPWRALEGGEMLVPDLGDDEPLQFIDVRDLGGLDRPPGRARRARRLQRHRAGERPGLLLERADRRLPGRSREARRAAGRAGAGGRGLPARPRASSRGASCRSGCLPTDPENRGHSRVDIQRAEHTRLTTRPLEQTIAAVMDEGIPPEDDPRRRGKLGRAREAELLGLWHARPAEAAT